MGSATLPSDGRQAAQATEPFDPARTKLTALVLAGLRGLRSARFCTWYWLAIPALAIAAYFTVLRVGFLGDDFVLTVQADSSPLGDWLLPQPGNFLYRPVGLLLIWKLGIALWGFNPLPFHVQGLLLHAMVSLVLGLWLARVTSRRMLGWLGGAVFAVFPLPTEAVAWIAAQWDLVATLFALLSAWSFSIWWTSRSCGELDPGKSVSKGCRSRVRSPYYALSILFFILALFTKDSMLSFLPLLPLSAWVSDPHFTRSKWLQLLAWLGPFVAVLLLNLTLRYATWGSIGGYAGVRTDYPNFFFDALLADVRVLLAPLNPEVVGATPVQVVGALSLLGLLVGLVVFGRQWPRLLAASGIWIVVTLVPVLNLPLDPENVEQNRVLYLPAIGYCTIVAALLYSAIQVAFAPPELHAPASGRAGMWGQRLRGEARIMTIGGVALLLLACSAVVWLELRPWHTASVISIDLEKELIRLIPPPDAHRRNIMTWYVEGLPHDYKGAYLPHLALGMARYYMTASQDTPAIREVGVAADVVPAREPVNSFVMGIRYFPDETRYHVDSLSGITAAASASAAIEGADRPAAWDFTSCDRHVLEQWQVRNAQASCEPGATNGLALRQPGDDVQVIGPSVDFQPVANGARFMRIRVSIRYPAQAERGPVVSEWYWQGSEPAWSPERAQQMEVQLVGKSEVYWTFVPVARAGRLVSQLRFDPANVPIASVIQWVAVDMVR